MSGSCCKSSYPYPSLPPLVCPGSVGTSPFVSPAQHPHPQSPASLMLPLQSQWLPLCQQACCRDNQMKGRAIWKEGEKG